MNTTETTLNPNLIPFDDTYVLYNPQDPISFLCVYFSLLPIGILLFYFSWFLCTRELEAVIIAGGHVLNDILNNIVKNIIKQPRPNFFGDSFQKGTIRSGYGMPSAHSQFMGFFAIYHTLRILLYWQGLSQARKFLSIVVILVAALCVAGSRVYLGYHNTEQVVIGVSLGACAGSLYFLAVGIVRELGLIDWVLSWPIVKRLWVKDSCYYAPLSLQAEHEAWEKRRKTLDSKKLA